MTTLLHGMTAVSDAHLQSLHDRLASNADSVDLLEVGYRTLDSPVGILLQAATPEGLVRVAYHREDFDEVLKSLAVNVSPRLLAAPKRLDGVARELDEYFAGQRQHFEVPLDLRLSKGFQRSVLAFLPDIHYGQTATYASVAAAVHHSGAVRAVGTACARNPLPVIIPCHRVIRSDGHAGAYLGGPEVNSNCWIWNRRREGCGIRWLPAECCPSFYSQYLNDVTGEPRGRSPGKAPDQRQRPAGRGGVRTGHPPRVRVGAG